MSNEKIGVEISVEDKFSQQLNNLDQKLNGISTSLENLNKKTEQGSGSMNKFATGAMQAAQAFAGFSVIKGMVSDFQSAEMAQNKLNKAFDNSKGIGVTKKELQDLGKTLEDKTLFGGEAIASVQTKLISFRNIGGDSFKRATELALDFATATGQDASTGATMLGKALSNPAEGLNALKKAGVDFNKEQEIMIQKMVESGNIQQAQKTILDELEKTYKGQAEAQIQGAGSIAYMTHKFSQLSEEIGKHLFGFIEPFVKFINDSVIPVLNDWGMQIAEIIGVLGLVVVAINGVSLAMSLLTKSNAILLGITLAIVGVIEAFKNWDAIVEWVGINFQKLKVFALEVVRVMANFVPALMPFKDKFDEMIVDAKKKVGELEKEKADKAQKRRDDELEAEKKAKAQENEAKVKADKDYQEMIKKLNAQAKKDKQAQTQKEIEDEFQKKLKQYDNLSTEDIKFLRDEDKRAREQKTKNLKLQRMSYDMLSKEDKTYLDEKAEFEVKEQNKQFKKDQTIMKRKMKLTEQFNSDYAEAVISKEKQISDEKQEQENQKMMIEQNIGNARFEAAQAFLGQMSQLQQVKSKEMFEIGKAAAIGNAIVSAYEGISKTLSIYPFPISAGMAAAQAAIAFAQVQNISSQSPAFENGGIPFIEGNSYTGDKMNVRVNSGEMILNQRQQKNLFDKVDSGNLGGNSAPPQINNIYNVKIVGNGEKYIQKQVEKTIKNTEKRKLQKQQFVRGRFAT